LILLLAVPRVAGAQGGDPVGPEFRANAYTTGSQLIPAVAADPSGNFIVLWQGAGPDDVGIWGQRFAGSGGAVGQEFRANTSTTGSQFEPSVATDSAGNFVVVWTRYFAGQFDVFGRRFASDGAPLGPQFRVNTFTAHEMMPDVAMDPAGNFVVVWGSAGPDVFGQRFASSGVPVGPEFRVNTSTTDGQGEPKVTADSAGNFVVAWTSTGGYLGPAEIVGQRFASDGTPAGPEFRVNTYTTYLQRRPDIAADPSGNFVVIWDGGRIDDPSGVFGQRFASSGPPLGSEFRVNSATTDLQVAASVAADSAGNFVVAWLTTEGSGGVPGDIFGQRFAADGTPLGPEFRVNTYTGHEYTASVAADAAGNFVVVWDGLRVDDPTWGIFGQRYGRIVPVELMDLEVE